MLELPWLTPEAREFISLDGGYLRDQTAEERYEQICKTIGKIANSHTEDQLPQVKDIAKRFRRYVSNGWVSFASPVLANFGHKHNFPISCVSEDTWINTYDGGKQAKDIKIGDMVLTHKGRFRPVLNLTKTENRSDIWRLKVVTRMTDLLLTGDHRVKTNMGWTRVDDLDSNKHLIAINNVVDFGADEAFTIDLKLFADYKFLIIDGKICKAAETLLKSNSLQKNEDATVAGYSTPNEFVAITEELAWAIGLWFADGSISRNNKKEPNGIRLTQNISEKQIAEKWLKIVSESFGINGSTYTSEVDSKYSKRGKATWLNVNVNSKIVGNFFDSFGEGCLKKELPAWVISLPTNILSEFLKGILSGDGSSIANNGNSITLSNPRLLLQVYNIGLKLNLPMSLQMQQKPGKFNKTKWTYKIIFRHYTNSSSRWKCSSGTPFEDGLVYAPIRTLEKTGLEKTVYDFEVAEDHSFTCSGVVVHNCNYSWIDDSLDAILTGLKELGMLSKYGAGVAVNFSDLRPAGSKISAGGVSEGIIPFISLYEDLIKKVSQNGVRRGFMTAYLSVNHPEIMAFLDIGSDGHPIKLITTGVTIPKGWMQLLKDGDSACRKIWSKILKSRSEIGYPYILFEENCNNENSPQVYRDKGFWINSSNICTEILGYCDKDTTFACCISSVVLNYYDDWKNDPNFIFDMNIMLDCALEEYIQKAIGVSGLEKAVKFAKEHRTIGLGVLGFHSLLQKKSIVLGSLESFALNNELFKLLRSESDRASKWMAQNWGEPSYMAGTGYRNGSRIAVAPTKSTSEIAGGYSLGIEPIKSNYHVKKLAKSMRVYKNPDLIPILKNYKKDTRLVWNSILDNNGSVQHLDFLSEHEKQVFRTFAEVSQSDLISLASQRQKYIDQGQSLNLMFHPKTPPKEINRLLLEAYDSGIKTLYYQYSISAAQEFNRELLTCSACEG